MTAEIIQVAGYRKGTVHEVDVAALVEYENSGTARARKRFCSPVEACAVAWEGTPELLQEFLRQVL